MVLRQRLVVLVVVLEISHVALVVDTVMLLVGVVVEVARNVVLQPIYGRNCKLGEYLSNKWNRKFSKASRLHKLWF